MSTFISRFSQGGTGPRLAVKDAIDVKGVPTTVGSRLVATTAHPAAADAACLAGARDAEIHIVGKTNLHELCFGNSGVNPWFGTPVNPLDHERVPGGSSSGSAVAVATHEADMALGTDTAGSIRNPAACCGVVGLKTTWGRIPTDGVWPLAPFLDTVGILAASVTWTAQGMALLEPGFGVAHSPPRRIGRVRTLTAVPSIEMAVDRALLAAGFELIDIALPGWEAAADAAVDVLLGEALEVHRDLVEDHRHELGDDVQERFSMAEALPAGALAHGRALRGPWREELAAQFADIDLLALPTMLDFPALLSDDPLMPNPAAVAVNLAGHPALALPVPTDGPLPASLQLVGPDHSEDRLLLAGAIIEGAVA